MAESVDCSEFCRICLVKDQANVPIFEEQGDMQQTYLKISTCLPIKVSYEDSLPKRICDGCNYKLEQQYQFWNTSLNAEKQLKQWLGIPDVPEVVEAPLKIKREKDSKANVTTKRPRRNARRKAAVNVRQVVAAVAASDSGPGEDMDMDNSFGKDDDMDHNDYNENSDALTDSPFINSNIDSEQVQAGPSGLQKNTDVENADVEETPGPTFIIKTENIKQEFTNDSIDFEYQWVQSNVSEPDIKHNISLNKKRNNNASYKCDVCETVFTRKKEFNKHKKSHGIDTKKWSCFICGNDYDTLELLREHDSEHYNGLDYKCGSCNKKFVNKYILKNHFIAKHKQVKFECNECLKTFTSKEYLSKHSRTHNLNYVPPTYTCSTCNKVYQSASVFHRHVRSHEGFPCDQCGKMFKYAERLKHHNYIHTGERPYACTYCDKKFRVKTYLNEHIRTHTKERPFTCSVCGQAFTQPNPLKVHMRTHTGERPFSCVLCDEAFISKHRLSLHLQKNHQTLT